MFSRLWLDVGTERPAATPAHDRLVVAKRVGIIRQPPSMRLMPGLRATGTGILPRFLPVRRGRLRRRPRCLIRPLQPHHQLNQLILAQTLQITAIHGHMDSEIGDRGKGWVITRLEPEDRSAANRYFDRSPLYSAHFAHDWNRSFILTPRGDPVGAAVLLHGLTDSPYSVRHIAEMAVR